MFFEDVCLQDWFDLVWAPEQQWSYFSSPGLAMWLGQAAKKQLPAVLHRFMQSNISPEST